MKVVDAIGAFLAGVLALAALSLIVAPDSKAATVVSSFGTTTANLIKAAKNYPA